MKRVALTLAMVMAVPTLAAELEGVSAPDTIQVAGKELVLNGQGLRKKFLFNVYVATMYLEKKTQSPADLFASDTVRVVKMTMLRDLGSAKITDAIREGFEKNAGDQMPALKERLDGLCAAVPDIKKGLTLTIQYVPGKGTTLFAGDKTFTAPGKDFADAMFSVWLGKAPVDASLKKGMLGQQ